jgi:hypothetical protein
MESESASFEDKPCRWPPISLQTEIISAFVGLLTPVLAKDSKRLLRGCPSYGHGLDSDKGIRSPVSRHTQFGVVFAPLRGSFPSGNDKHRDCSPPLGETRQFKIQTALIFKLEALRYAGQDPETLDRLALR